jgi:dolichyl-phosphate beta-glucosyltransferase
VSRPALSVVIPAYNEAERLPATLRRIGEYLELHAPGAEILIVDDGSRDGTAAQAAEASAGRARVLSNDGNRGKGYSVRRGMLAASGARRLMTDADLSTPIEDLPLLMAPLDAGYDIAIGSRAVAGARVEVHQSRYRESVGRAFNLLVQLLALPGLHDTQCGFKLFTADAAEEAFGAARLDGFSFDVEALYVARLRGRRIAEVPVTWRNDAATRVTLFRGVLAFADLARIRWNGLLGRYGRSSTPRT